MGLRGVVMGRLCSALVLAATCVALGEEPVAAGGADYTLGDVVVTATGEAQSVVDIPYASGLVSADQLRLETAIRSLPEALKYQPGIMVQKTSHGQGSPYIRGFTGYRTLLLIDGVRVNHAAFRDGPNQYWNTVDPFGVAKFEAVRGPFSVLYGSDAVGGTVQAITRGEGELREGSDWDRRLFYRYSSAEHSHVARGESIGRLADSLTLTLGYSYKDFGDVEGGRDVGTQPKTGYQERDWDAKLEYDLRPGTTLVLAHQSVDIDGAWRTHKTIYGIDWEGLSVGSDKHRILDQARDLTYLQLHHYGDHPWVQEVHAGVSRQYHEEVRDRLRSRARQDYQGFELEAIGGFLTLRSDSALGSLTYGVDLYRDRVDSFRRDVGSDGVVEEAIQGPVADDATYDRLGLFLQDRMAVAGPVELLLGARYEWAEANAKRVLDPVNGGLMQVSDAWDDAVGSIRGLYYVGPSRSVSLFAGLSQGFRAPNLSDLTRLDSARTDEIETPSPDLDPETFVSYEAGITWGTAGMAGQLVLFHTDIDGMIVRTPTGRTVDGDREVTKRNGGDGYLQGVEVGARASLWRSLSGFGTFTWIDGEVDTYPTSEPLLVREPMDRLMPPTARLGLRWAPPAGYWVEASTTLSAKADRLSTRDMADSSRIPEGGTPGYVVADLRGGYRFANGCAFSLAIENVTDEDYRIHGSGLNEPGRNLLVALDTVF